MILGEDRSNKKEEIALKALCKAGFRSFKKDEWYLDTGHVNQYSLASLIKMVDMFPIEIMKKVK